MIPFARKRPVRAAVLFVSLPLLIGCDPAGLDGLEVPNSRDDASYSDLPSIDSAQAPPAATETTELWDVIYMSGHPVGYQALTLMTHDAGETTWLDATARSEIKVVRFGQSTRESIQMTSRETPDGQVVEIQSRIRSGVGEIHTLGRRQGNALQMEIRSGERSRQWSLPLPPACGGFFAVEWSLVQRQLEAGEARKLFAVVPMLNQIAEIRLTAGPLEPVNLLSDTVELRRIDQSLTLPNGMTIESVSWVGADGQVMKTEMAELQQISYRVDRKTALAAMQQASFDLGRFSTVKVQQHLKDPHNTKRIRYRVRLDKGDPARTFVATAGQSVTSISANTAEITVRSLQPDGRADGQPNKDSAPRPEDQEPSTMIQSDAPSVTAMAQRIQPLRPGDWGIAVATERFVFQTITQKDFSTAFATAAEVAQSRQGDCTEHAVLTAALCRAQGVPARVLVGLVYVASQQAFVFHMWNEVWVQGGWIPLDSTLGLGRVPATHLILTRSSLATGDAFSSLLPVMRVMGQLKIEVLDVQYQ